MNYAIIRYILGWVLTFEGIFMLLPCIVALCYQEVSGIYFLICALASILIGRLTTRKKPENTVFYAREGFVACALSWILLSLVGAIPLYASREIPSITDALFEIISGFTTTGSSILTDVEALSKCMLFWRSFSHWIGGMGVLVFLLAILPMAGGQNMHLMRAESPGPSVGKLVPNTRKTASLLYAIYIVMTVVQIILMLLGGMPLFDALCIGFGTAGTGGFGILNSSIGEYNTYIQIVVTIFMFLFGVNFNFYYLFLIRRPKDALKMEEVRGYVAIYLAAVLLITLNLTAHTGNFLYNLQHVAFQVSSIMTTTGFATVDFNLWPQFSRALMVTLMFIGACAGSTGGGMKVSRFVMYYKALKKEFSALIHPRSVKIVKVDDKALEHETVRSANVYLLAYAMIFVVSFLLITLDGFDLETSFTAVVATINNIGPGLNMVGATGNFSEFSILSKYVMMFDMLAGRLEVFPMLLLFLPSTWRKN